MTRRFNPEKAVSLVHQAHGFFVPARPVTKKARVGVLLPRGPLCLWRWLPLRAASAIMLPSRSFALRPELWKQADAPGQTVTNARRQRRRSEPRASVGCHHDRSALRASPGQLTLGSAAQERQPMLIVAPRAPFCRARGSLLLECRAKCSELSHTLTIDGEPSHQRPSALVLPLPTSTCLARIAAPVNLFGSSRAHERPCIPRAVCYLRGYKPGSGCISRLRLQLPRHACGGASCSTR